MHISVIDNIEQFEKLKEDWDAVSSIDPDTTMYASWEWIRGWIETISYKWFVMAIKLNAESSYIAFMPLGIQSIRKGRINLIRKRKLVIGGDPWSENTGFACLPEYVERAIPAFAEFIQKYVKWDIFHMRNVFDPRLDLFLKFFSQKGFEIKMTDSPCNPEILLPDNWDKYLHEFLGSDTRRSLKYSIRKIEKLNEFHVTQARADNLESQIETLLTLWQTRFGPKPKDFLNRIRILFRHCCENNSLWLPILWEGTTPIAALAAFLDHKKKIFSLFIPAFNNKFAKMSPGKVMVGYSIRYAIENGFRKYDFGLGKYDYKFSFGAIECCNKDIIIERKTFLKSLKNRVMVKIKK